MYEKNGSLKYNYGDVIKYNYDNSFYIIVGYEIYYEQIGELKIKRNKITIRNIETGEIIVKEDKNIEVVGVDYIDFLLDEYNKYIKLEEIFSEKKYEKEKSKIIKLLKEFTNKKTN